jgi:hypothetical protein
MRPRIAVGGLDLESGFGGEKVSKNKRLKMQVRKMEEGLNFEYDPNKKLKKGGKVGKHAFKSKGRYKRR